MNLHSSGCDPGRAEEQLIGALVPDLARPVPAAPVPLSVLPPPPRQASQAPVPTPMVDAAQVDRSGRVQSGRVLHALHWCPGDDLLVELVTDSAGDVAALLVTPALPDSDGGSPPRHLRPHAAAGFSVPGRHPGAITFPSAARALCDIDVGDTVVLIAEPVADRLFVCPALLASQLLLDRLLAARRKPESRTPHPDEASHDRGGRHAT